MARILAIIQARIGSTRMPGKTLKPLCGMPLIIFMLKRVMRSRYVEHVVVATSVEQIDDVLAECIEENGIACYRGALDDVLSRFYMAAKEIDADIIVRLTGDCPLMDPDLIDKAIYQLMAENVDYVANTNPPTYPDGLDVEAFTFYALEQAYLNAKIFSEREHVTPYIRHHPELFRLASFSSIVDGSNQRWTVDYQDDYEFICRLVELAGVNSPGQGDRFDFLRVLEQHPEILRMNQHERNEGYTKSLANDV